MGGGLLPMHDSKIVMINFYGVIFWRASAHFWANKMKPNKNLNKLVSACTSIKRKKGGREEGLLEQGEGKKKRGEMLMGLEREREGERK